MSVAAKKRLTEFVVGLKHPKRYRVPADKAKGVLILLSDYLVRDDEESLTPDETFKYLYDQHGKAGTILRGCRARDEMSQIELAKKLGTSQSAVASMENGSRPISKAMAHKLAKIFDTDYRNFL
jgi:DNA-binding XRE family transcriptional regulator